MSANNHQSGRLSSVDASIAANANGRSVPKGTPGCLGMLVETKQLFVTSQMCFLGI